MFAAFLFLSGQPRRRVATGQTIGETQVRHYYFLLLCRCLREAFDLPDYNPFQLPQTVMPYVRCSIGHCASPGIISDLNCTFCGQNFCDDHRKLENHRCLSLSVSRTYLRDRFAVVLLTLACLGGREKRAISSTSPKLGEITCFTEY